jgi:peptidoglycan lytic transglycosylase
MNGGRRAVLALALSALAGCSGNPLRHEHRHDGAATGGAGEDNVDLPQSRRYLQPFDSAPDGGGVDVATLPEPVPASEPPSRYGNKSPYTVDGETYYVLPSATGYDERGIASYYGTKFNGYRTSDLETYDMYKFTAASRVLPLPSFARVTNLDNGKSVIVRVNDRGPFVPDRIIDLSYAAAVRIGIWPKGTGLVEVQGIDPSHPDATPAPAAAGPTPAAGAPRLYLQVGAFADRENAERLAASLRAQDFGPVRVVDTVVGGHTLARVQIGPLSGADETDRVSARLKALGLPHPTVAVH